MNLNEAIKHLTWRFSNFKRIKVSQKDLESINFLIAFVNTQNLENIGNNQLAFKLYLALWRFMILHYNSNITYVVIQKEIHRSLAKTPQYHIESFTDFLNDRELDLITEHIPKDRNNLSQSQVDEYLKLIKKASTAFTAEEVEGNLGIMFSEALRNFS